VEPSVAIRLLLVDDDVGFRKRGARALEPVERRERPGGRVVRIEGDEPQGDRLAKFPEILGR